MTVGGLLFNISRKACFWPVFSPFRHSLARGQSRQLTGSEGSLKRPFLKAGQRVFKGVSTDGQWVINDNQNQRWWDTCRDTWGDKPLPQYTRFAPPDGPKNGKNCGFFVDSIPPFSRFQPENRQCKWLIVGGLCYFCGVIGTTLGIKHAPRRSC